MYKFRHSLLAGLVLSATSAFSGQVTAADSAERYAVRGAGAQQCEQFLSYLQSRDANAKREAVLIYDAWLAGYTTHVNRVSKETYDVSPIVNAIDMLNLLVEQCQRNPKALVESIVAGVLSALSTARVAEESNLVTIGDGESQRSYRKATIIDVQQKLIDLKYLKGNADGRFGPKSGEALIKFQKDEGLDPSGFLDRQTILKILLK